MKPTIYIQQAKSYLRVIDECTANRNDGIIKTINKKCSSLSLKLDGNSPRYLIGEIAALGGNFYGEENYKDCESPVYASKGAGGCGFEGYVSFESVEDAIKYLEQYFNIEYCDLVDSVKIKFKSDNPIKKPEINNDISNGTNFILSDLVKECIPDSISKYKSSRFHQFYDNLKKAFDKNGMLKIIDGIDAAPKNLIPKSNNWPKEPGVYVVREKSEPFKIIYVGKSGLVRKFEDEISGQLDERLSRWDPYCFLPNAFYYNYKRASKKPKDSESYDGHIDVDKFQVDCFMLNKKSSSAPAFLEAIILEMYFETYFETKESRIPIANNAF